MTWDLGTINRFTETIIGCGFRVPNTLEIGFVERVYHNELAHEINNKSWARR